VTRRAALLTIGLALIPAATAAAADPIMPLSEVRPGMECRGLSVVRGTEISSFDVEVIDIVDARPDGARILVEASGPAVEPAGIGSGFSGSPVLCRGDDGQEKNAGAISEGVGDYGNRLALTTPIEEILAEPAYGAPAARPLPARYGPRRPLAAPLTISGLAPSTRRLLAPAFERSGRTVIDAPAAASSRFPPQDLRPGASVAAGYSTGDLQVSAVGTVTYRDGNRVWGFGHPLDGVGPRALFLQDAYVYTVVNNPNGGFAGVSYKLAAPGHELGTVTSDALDAIIGELGPLPPATQLRAAAREQESGRLAAVDTQVADENDVDQPLGNSPLRLLGPLAIFDAGTRALRGTPARQSGDMCLSVALRERPEPMRFCNRYVADSDPLAFGGSVAASMAADYDVATALIDSATFARLHVESVKANMHVRRGLAQAHILGVRAPRRARRGQLITISVRYRIVRGAVGRARFRWRVPSRAPRGRVELRVTGPGLDSDAGGDIIILDFGGGDSLVDPGPQSLEELAQEFAAIERYDGLRVRIADPDDDGDEDAGERRGKRAYRHPELRLTGAGADSIRIQR
jgi:hypothetical protein